MAYYGGGPPPHAYSGPQGSGPIPQQMYGNQVPPATQHSGMYPQGGSSQGHFNEYNGNQMHSSYSQHQEYIEPQQHQMYDPSHNQGRAPLDPRSQMMHASNSSQSGRGGETTKILRNPYPIVSDEKKKSNEIYDPSNPTGPTSSNLSGGHGQFNHQRVAPPPPTISGVQSGSLHSMSMSGHLGASQQQPAPIYDNRTTQVGNNNGGIYGNAPYGNNAAHLQTQQPQPQGPPQASYQAFQGTQYANSNPQPVQQQPPPAAASKMQVMTGVVTQVQPGSFGMVSEEIFFQEHVVSGPLPRLGDKVVVEAEPVNGMPFKFNAKRVTRLDVDLVREEKNTAPPIIQQQQPQQPQQYQNLQPSQQFQNPQPTQNYPQSNHDFGSRWEAPNFGPLPSLPDSLNLPRPVPPPKLASVLPSSDSNLPLKSILKRNPPPPPVISKNAGKQDVNPFRKTAPSSLKQNVFAMDLERDVPRVLPPQGTGPPIEFPEYTFFNKERPRVPDVPASPRITRLLPQSPIPEFGGRRSNSVDNFRNQQREREKSRSRSRDRDRARDSPKRRRSRSKSPRRHAPSRRSRSRSVSPKRRSSRRSRSRSVSPKRVASRRSRSRSISPRRSRRTHSRSPSPTRHRRYSRSPSPRSRRRSRSVTPTSRPRTSRSVSRDRDRRSDSRGRRNYRNNRRSRSRSTSRSKSKSPYRSRYSSGGRRSRSNSPRSSGGVRVLGETITHGIVVKHVSSDLFPKIKGRAPEVKEVEVIRRDGKGNSSAKPVPLAPIKFQISNPSNKPAPLAPSSLVPNPTFKTTNMAPPTYLQNPVFNITKTVSNPLADAKNKRKRSKEQEPAFRVIDEKQQSVDTGAKPGDDKIKQWEAERQALKAKTVENVNNLLKNPVNVLQLKQTIQNDLHELRTKSQSDVGKKLLENPIDIEKLKQTVQRDLQAIKSKEITQSTSSGAKEKNNRETKSPVPVINKVFDEKVEQRLKDLRSKFENQIKDAKASVAATTPQRKSVPESKTSPTGPSKSSMEKQKVSLVTDNLKNNNKAPVPRFPNRQVSDASSERSRGPPSKRHGSPPPIELPPYDEQMEHLQEEIHQQRFMEEEQRLKSMGDEQGLHQLYYMEDRRRRRMDERHLARIRMTEIQLKKDKKFGELARLREEWGPPARRMEQERELRQARMNEEQHENQLHGQAEAIRRQEYEYQQWLEEEAAARSRNSQGNPRPSRGCEGRVLRRRTPSPSNQRSQPPPNHHGPPPDARGPHPLRRRSRSPSFERYKADWFSRHPRDRSPPMNYEQFTMRYPIGPPGNFMPPDDFRPHPNFHGPPHQLEEEGFFISRAMDDVARRQDELMHREMEIQQRIEMAQRRIGGGGPPPHRGGPIPPNRNDRDSDREEIRRYAVPRR